MYSNSNEKELPSNTSIGTLGLDSMGVMAIVAELENEYRIEINIAKLGLKPDCSVTDIAGKVCDLIEKEKSVNEHTTDEGR